jgi:hypothetical protein
VLRHALYFRKSIAFSMGQDCRRQQRSNSTEASLT